MPVNAPKTDTIPATEAQPNPAADATPQTEPNVGTMTLKTADTISVAGKGTFTVAPGRTLVHGVLEENDGVKSVRNKAFNPGDKIDLGAGEAESLIKMGFLLDTDGSIVVRADGPAVNVDDSIAIANPA